MLSAKEYLSQLEKIDTFINQDIERLNDMKLSATSTGAIDYSKDRVQTSPVNALETRICKYVDLEKQIDTRIDEFVNIKEQIIAEIRGLPNNMYIQVLYKVYVQFKSLRETSREIGRSYPNTLDLHKKALKMFEETYKNRKYLI